MTGTAIPESDDTESTHFWVHSALSFLDNSKWNICAYKTIKITYYLFLKLKK